MSLFERKNEEELNKRNLDESVQLKASIISAINVNNHTVWSNTVVFQTNWANRLLKSIQVEDTPPDKNGY